MRILSTFLGLMAAVTAAPAIAQSAEHIGKPEPKGMGFQPAATELATQIHRLDWLILVIITLIVVFVTGLLIWVMIRYNEKSNPTPSRTSHNTMIEIIWTVVPILILVLIAIPSFKLLINTHEVEDAEMTLKSDGKQMLLKSPRGEKTIATPAETNEAEAD